MTLTDRILTIPTINRVRRNHGLEHATIHVLSSRVRHLSIAGRSTAHGFYLYGNVTTAQVRDAVHNALARMRAGEHELAIHPGCGTNLVTTSGLGALAAFAAFTFIPRRGRFGFDRIPFAMFGIMFALIAGQPLGMRLQELVTTNGDPGDLRIVSVQQTGFGRLITHRVDTIS